MTGKKQNVPFPPSVQQQPLGFDGIRSVEDWTSAPLITVEEKRFLPIAHAYTSSLPWMKRRTGFWHGLSVRDLVAVFLYQIDPPSDDIPQFHWIVVGPLWPYPIRDESGVDQNEVNTLQYGGLPNAYIWTGYPEFSDGDSASNPIQALEAYHGAISDWVDAVLAADDLSRVFPVAVPADKTSEQYARDVSRHLKMIEPLIGG